MRRWIAFLVGAGLWAAAATAQVAPVNLDPISFRVVYGVLKCCEGTEDCDEISRDVEALHDADRVCLKVSLGSPVELELTFQTTLAVETFRVRVVSNAGWYDVISLRSWDDGGFDEVPMSAADEDGVSTSGPIPASYVDPGSGTIVVRLTSYAGPAVRDDKTVDEVDIVIPSG